MSASMLGALSLPLLLALIFLRMPIAAAMFLCGLLGSVAIAGRWAPVLAQLKTLPFDTFSNANLGIVPLFLLMGQFATRGGLSRDLFAMARAWLGHRRGGLALAAIGACAGFGAICGSSTATAATMGQVALPELRRHGYSAALATGTLAAGGTLGILIPPSVVLAIYAMLTEQNIATLFLAAFLPGILAMLGYMAAVRFQLRSGGPEAPAHLPPLPWGERWAATRAVWPVLAVFALVFGGIYGGVFTPTEAAAIGAAGTGAAAWRRGGLGQGAWLQALLETASATATILFIVLGATVYNIFLASSGLPGTVASALVGLQLPPLAVLVAILVLYLVLGCVMDSLSMIVLTVPIFFPLLRGLDFGLGADATAIWFGILALVAAEVGLITPPVGMNLFVIAGMAPDVPVRQLWRGVVPFIVSDLLRLTLLVLFPGMVLFVL